MTSSTVTMPSSFWFSSTTGIAWTSYLETSRATSSWSVSAPHGQEPALHHVGDLPVRGRGEEPAQGHVPDEAAGVVDGIEALDGLDLGVDALEVLAGSRPAVHSGRIVANFIVMSRPAVRGG